MKNLLILIFSSILFFSCDSYHSKMGFYEIGEDPESNAYYKTYITLINSSEKDYLGGDNKTIYAYTFFFDDNETLLKCRFDTLTSDDMILLDVEEILGNREELTQGVIKSVAVDSTSELINVLIGYQTKKIYLDSELISVSESALSSVATKIDPHRVIETYLNCSN